MLFTFGHLLKKSPSLFLVFYWLVDTICTRTWPMQVYRNELATYTTHICSVSIWAPNVQFSVLTVVLNMSITAVSESVELKSKDVSCLMACSKKQWSKGPQGCPAFGWSLQPLVRSDSLLVDTTDHGWGGSSNHHSAACWLFRSQDTLGFSDDFFNLYTNSCRVDSELWIYFVDIFLKLKTGFSSWSSSLGSLHARSSSLSFQPLPSDNVLGGVQPLRHALLLCKTLSC